ncbi:MAG: hypothetical protein ACI35T_06215 [Alistipes sp.]
MTLALIIFGLMSGSLLCILVGIVGSRRRIGFGWTFLISVIFTPLVGLIAALLSDPLPAGAKRWGCIGTLLAVIAIALLLAVFSMIFWGSLAVVI